MTIWDTTQALLRHWYVLIGAVMIGLLASYSAMHEPGVYWSRAEVTFLAPTSAVNPNALTVTSSDLIIAAGAVAKRVNGNVVWNQMADPAATIVGQGILDGSTVQLPNYGGQWSKVYSRQVLDVQVSGPTPEDVRARQRTLIDRINTELAGLQKGTRASDLITTTVVPADPSIFFFGGSPMRAVAMIWVLCGVGVFAAVQILEPRALRQRWAGVVPPDVPRHRTTSKAGRASATTARGSEVGGARRSAQR
ncbi:hypothetical protein ACPPVS_03015 [Cellulomonas sp. McL0617]|uniref:hypothetical protein n=1 Tax=Cellulomonas sp. McL0617 TaxID=3415675 RepID=UPI003CEE986C